MAIAEMISPEEARELVLSVVSPLEAEEVPLLEAVGRVAAQPVVSDIDVTAFNNSAMDGFAMRAQQLEGASPESPVELDVIAEVAAGDFFHGVIQEGQCVRIMTGAAVPESADAVVTHHGHGSRRADRGKPYGLVQGGCHLRRHGLKALPQGGDCQRGVASDH